MKPSNKKMKENATDAEFEDVLIIENKQESDLKKNKIANLVSEQRNKRKTDLINMLTDSQENSSKDNKIKPEKKSSPSKNDSRRKSLVDMLASSSPDSNEKAPEKAPKKVVEKAPKKAVEKAPKKAAEKSLSVPAFSSDSELHLSALINSIVPKENLGLFLEKVKLHNSTSGYSIKDAPAPNISTSKKSNGDVLLIHWNGRFGNRMHTYAYLHNRAKKLNGQVYLPSHWEGTELFNLDYKIIEDDDLRLSINQSIKPFDSLSHRLEKIREYNLRSGSNFQYCNPDDPKDTYRDFGSPVCVDSVCAYHHKIFDEMKLSDVLKIYEFSDKVKNLDIYKRLEDIQGTYDIAHLRRDDISNPNTKNNGGYSVISKDAYLKAFKHYGYDPEKIEWTTDDWSGKWGVGNSIADGRINKRGSWRYPTGAEVLPGIIFDWLPDFLRLYFARSIFRANSSFSFWACTLAKGRETPPKIFSPRLNKRILFQKEETLGQEAHFNFEEGNHPHWLCITGKDNCDSILFSDESKPKKKNK